MERKLSVAPNAIKAVQKETKKKRNTPPCKDAQLFVAVLSDFFYIRCIFFFLFLFRVAQKFQNDILPGPVDGVWPQRGRLGAPPEKNATRGNKKKERMNERKKVKGRTRTGRVS